MKILFSIVLSLCSALSFGQIELSEESEIVKEERKKEKKMASEKQMVNSTVEIIGYSTWSSTSRILEMNDEPYGDSLFERANEGGLNTWSFGLGLRSHHGNYFSWEGSIAYIRNGESYLFEETDTMYSYKSTYSYIGMPLMAYFNYKKNFVTFYAGGGVVPQMFTGFRQDVLYRTETNHEVEESSKTTIGYNSFVLSVKAACGVELNLGKSTSVFVFPEYRYQLVSSLEKIADYKHFAKSLNIKFGLSYKLQ